MYERMGKKKKFFLTIGRHLTKMEGMTEIENTICQSIHWYLI